MADDPQDNNESIEERRFSQDQYEMLKRCSDAGNITEWNLWRKNNPNEPILLEDAEFIGTAEKPFILNRVDLSDAFLKGVKFHYIEIRYANFAKADLESGELLYSEANHATFSYGNLQKLFVRETDLSNSVFDNCRLMSAEILDVVLRYANLKNTNLREANLTKVNFTYATLVNCIFSSAHLINCLFRSSNLTESSFTGADIKETDFTSATLAITRFNFAIISGGVFSYAILENINCSGTTLNKCKFIETKLTNVDFDD